MFAKKNNGPVQPAVFRLKKTSHVWHSNLCTSCPGDVAEQLDNKTKCRALLSFQLLCAWD